MDLSKENFLKKDLVPLLKKLQSYQKDHWGNINAQQMVEHFAEVVKNANGKLASPLLNTGERLKKFREFLMTDQPFKHNFKNPFTPDKGFRVRKPDMDSAINKLQKELNYFFELFGKHPELKTLNAFFGYLDYHMNLQLLHKHAMHHLKQFGLV